MDAAFDSQGYLYITPVVVAPDSGNPYVASAKLELSPSYQVVKIFDEGFVPNDNQDTTNLREIEVDEENRVYVTNSGYENSSDILWVYDSNGQIIKRCELQQLTVPGSSGGKPIAGAKGKAMKPASPQIMP